MKVVVITGSTRGIGFGLADAFLSRGCSVIVSGRTQEAVAHAVEDLTSHHDSDRILGVPCDVRQLDQVRRLWDESKTHFGRVDIWINNAGVAKANTLVWDNSPTEIEQILDTNLTGAIFGSQVAIKGMLEQGYGSIYNMEGMGSDGRKHAGMTLYGMTKYGLRYFTESIAEETSNTPLIIGALRPGMVITGLVTRQYDGRPEDLERARRVFNIIADRVENVAPWLADKMLNNQKTGVRINYLTKRKLMGRLFSAPFRNRDLFTESSK
jgi:NAD(P)-dependent dehydrogenase (short-subunit alcohol dehydrogenase family)